jgi:hypothetical protein
MAKRTLLFGPQDTERFGMLYTGFVIGGDKRVEGEQKGMKVIRLEGRVLDKLEGVSTEDPALGRRPLHPETDLVFEADEMELILKYVQRADWHTRVARKVVDLVDWLEQA